MSPERKGELIRGLLYVGMVAAAVAAALWASFPAISFGRKPDPPPKQTTDQVNPSTVDGIKDQKNCLVVMQCHEMGNGDSELLQKILAELKRDKYGEEVRLAELNVNQYPELAAKEGVTTENAPQLVFYVQAQRVGDYRGPWNKPAVERKIDEIIHGFLQRIGRNWLPRVHGMEPERGQEILPVLPLNPKS